MHWKKLGKIFDPTHHKLPNNCSYFAQSPQVLIFDDFIRIYFSTRALEQPSGKYLSHIAFVDLTKDFKTTIRVSTETVLPLGQLGCFDEHGIFPLNVLRYKNAIYGYSCGWSRRVSVSVDTAIGLVISHDQGKTFERFGKGPVLTASAQEPFLVGDGFVKIIKDVFHMWYIFGTEWKKSPDHQEAERVYKIGHATSENGIDWTKDEGQQIIEDRLRDECQALPSVIELGDRYHMFFCYRHALDFRNNKDRSYRIGHAYSDNLTTWTRDDENPHLDVSEDGWDSEMACYPHAFICDDKTYLLYNGNQFGRDGFGLALLEQ